MIAHLTNKTNVSEKSKGYNMIKINTMKTLSDADLHEDYVFLLLDAASQDGKPYVH